MRRTTNQTKLKVLICISTMTLSLVIFVSVQSSAQTLTQSIRGTVVDKESRRPLTGATISIAEDSLQKTTLTDETGNFILLEIPVGRRIVQCSFSGYQTFTTDNIILNSSRELELVIELEQQYQQQTEVVVKGARNPKLPVNKLAVVSARSFTPEETNRYAVSVNDPSRMAMSFPGVQPTKDSRNDIVIRGNSSVGMLWRLEGVDIPNPNHFARKGSSGGGITIFSSSMLDNSDFSSGAFPAEYGNAFSGVFDMRFRKGNNQKNQLSLKAGLIGLELAAEGPLKKGSSSYLVNYRYSTLGILNSLGFHLTDERMNNTFQDLSFNLNFPSKNNRSVFNIWAIGGLSREDYSAVEDVSEWDEYDDYAVYKFNTNMGAAGIGHSLQIGKTGLLKTSLAFMDQKITYVDDTLNTDQVPFKINDEFYRNGRISFASSYNTKLGSSINWKTGLFLNRSNFDFVQSLYDFDSKIYLDDVIDGEGNAFLIQPYTQFNFRINPKLSFNAGMHVLYLTLNDTKSFEPRASVQYRINPKHGLSFAAGLHGQIIPLGSYFYEAPDGSKPNLNLDIMKSWHYVLAYDWLMKANWRLHLEVYLQQLSSIPVVDDVNRTFWMLNMIEGYANEAWKSKGKGTNKGIDLTLEKFFSRGWFMLTSFSFFNSTYKPVNGNTYNTQYNSRTSGSLTAGREWKWKRDKTFSIGGKALYNGGMPVTPVLEGAPVNSREPVLDESKPYTEKVNTYFRLDTKLSLRKDKSKTAWTLSLDIQNILGIRNIDVTNRRYNPETGQWIYRTSGGLVPVISFQLDL